MQADFEIARWGQFELDVRRRLLLASGKPVKLDAIAFDLLVCLIARRDAPVTRDDIQACVWPGRIVEPGNVTVQLSAIRSAFRKVGDTQPHILTLPGPRYHFVADVTTGTAPSPAPPVDNTREPSVLETPKDTPPLPPSSRKHRRIGLASAGSVTALAALLLAGTMIFHNRTPSALEIPRLSMVVVPFRYQGADQSHNYLADEITDDLTIDLGHIPASTVIARESAEAVKNRTPQDIRRDLKVEYIITGTVTPEDASYHVDASLTDTSSGIQIWSRSYDEPKDLLSLARQAIVASIANNLHFQLNQLAATRSMHDRPDNPDALDLFFQARAELDLDDDQQGLAAAQGLLERAMAMQADFADAKAELGWLLLRKVQTIDDDDAEDKDWVEALRVIDEALHLAPKNSVAVATMARELFIKGRYREARLAALDALSIEPSGIEAHWVLANCSWMLGQLDAEAGYLAAIARLNPDGIDAKRVLYVQGMVALLQGHSEQAIDLLLRATSGETVPQPGAASMGREERASAWLIAAYGMNGEPDKARSKFQEYDSIWQHRSVWRFRAYLPRAVAALPGTKLVLKALHDAGMPESGDASVALPSPDLPCDGNIFSKTPLVLPHGRVVDTSGLLADLAATPTPLVLDVGLGVAGVPTAVWFDPGGPAQTTSAFVESVAARRTLSKTMPIVVMGDGPFGCSAYNAAKDLVAKGYENVSWYRGGEEEWAHSGNPAKDFRPE